MTRTERDMVPHSDDMQESEAEDFRAEMAARLMNSADEWLPEALADCTFETCAW